MGKATMGVANMHEAETHLSRLVEAAAQGEPFVIARAGRPRVEVIALDAEAKAPVRRTGFLAGRIRTPQDFDRMGADVIGALFDSAPYGRVRHDPAC